MGINNESAGWVTWVMGLFCCVIGCSNESGTRRCSQNVSFFRLPAVITHQGEKTEELSSRRRRTWLSRISRADIQSKSYPYLRVCSQHFLNGKPSPLYDDDSVDWAPSLNLGHHKEITTPSQKHKARKISREQTKKHVEAAKSLLALGNSHDETSQFEEVQDTSCTSEHGHVIHEDDDTGVGCQTELTGDYLSVLESDYNRLITENIQLKKKISSNTICEENLKNNNEKVKMLTGLPSYAVLATLFVYLSPYLTVTHSSVLSKFQQVMLVLIRLKLGLPTQYLADVFGISVSTVSKIFLNVLNIMYVKLQPCIYWPHRQELRETMPMEFRKHFGLRVAVIIDCFELFIERPSGLTVRAQTWSSYKHHNTAKYLIGITPQGSISFISPGYGGRASDKFITDDCGFLDKLVHGDIVLADRGFNISEGVAEAGCELKIPAFTKGKSQLPAIDVEQTRKLASVRIHVERVIGLLRNKFDIMHKTLPVDYLISAEGSVPTLDKIVTVCCALVNMCRSVVPFD